MRKVQVFLKLLEELATNFGNKFKKDIFWRTQFIVLAILFLLCVLNILIVIFSSEQLQIQIASVVISNVNNMLTGGITNPDLHNSTMLSELYDLRNTYILFIGGTSIITTLLFGYLVARIAFVPTKNALTSQKQFIGNIAHELRTPLATVRANNEILLWEAQKNSDVANLAHSNMEELDRIGGIINNLLTLNSFHHIEEMDFSYVDTSQIVSGSLRKYARHIENKKLVIIADIKDHLYVWGNQNAIEQIVDNIIKNAIAYTGDNGTITITALVIVNIYVLIKVTDTGIGIEQDKLHQIFEPFYQVDPSRSEALNSSGLGLAIVSELVKLHHGSITMDSIPSKGTSVELRLPLEPIRRIKRFSKHKKEKEHGISLNFTEIPQ